MHQDFLRGSDKHQRRVATLTALGTLLAVAVIAVAAYVVNVATDGKDGAVRISIETPYVAPGVKPGTKVILHGAAVGTITDLGRTESDVIGMSVSLDPNRIDGLTDAFEIDFRPENYFGVTALNVTPDPGGAPLESGAQLTRGPAGDYTMSTMIERGSVVATGTLSDEMVKTLEKILSYTNGLTPLLRSGLIVADQVAKTQKAVPSELLGNADDILETLPGFLGQTIDSATTIFEGDYNRLPDGSIGINDEVLNHSDEGLAVGSSSLFSATGQLLSSHATELTPAAEIVRLFAEPIPGLFGGAALGPRLSIVVDRLTAAFGGTGSHPSLHLRLVMNDLPSIGAPLALAGVLQEALPR